MKVLNEKSASVSVISVLEKVDITAGERTVLEEFDGLVEAPNWTGDGKYLIFNGGGLLYEFDLATKAVRRLETGFAVNLNNDHVLSPDGKWIGISDKTENDGKSRICIIPRTGGDPVQVTPAGPSYLHGWSPDTKTLAYCAERSGEYDVYTIPAECGAEVRLTDAPGLDDGPEYSPDGKYIYFNSVRSGLMQIWRMDPDGENQTQMTFDESNSWFAHVSPNGEEIAFITYKKGGAEPGQHPANKNVEIRLMKASGGGFRTLVKLFGGQGSLNVNSWSPDSREIAFFSYRLKEGLSS